MNKILKTIIIAGGILTMGCIALGVLAVAISPNKQLNTAQPRTQTATLAPRATVIQPTQPAPAIAPTDPPPQPTEAPTQAPPSLVVVSGKLVDSCKLSRIYEPDASKKLIAVQVSVRNNSTEQLDVNPLNFWLIDADGFVYRTELASCDEQIDVMKLAPGQAVQGMAGFHLPPNAKPVQIQYTGYRKGETNTAPLQ